MVGAMLPQMLLLGAGLYGRKALADRKQNKKTQQFQNLLGQMPGMTPQQQMLLGQMYQDNPDAAYKMLMQGPAKREIVEGAGGHKWLIDPTGQNPATRAIPEAVAPEPTLKPGVDVPFSPDVLDQKMSLATANRELNLPPIKAGEQYTFDSSGNVTGVEVRPNSELDLKRKAAAKREQNLIASQNRKFKADLSSTRRLTKKINDGLLVTGLGAEQVADWWAGSGAADAKGLISQLQSTLSFDKLQEMRANSPTGGALGNVSEGELHLLGSSVAALSQDLSPDMLMENLAIIEWTLTKMTKGDKAAGPFPLNLEDYPSALDIVRGGNSAGTRPVSPGPQTPTRTNAGLEQYSLQDLERMEQEMLANQ